MVEPSTVVVTGANGFIGTHLVSRFRASGWHVRALVHRQPTEPLPGVEYRVWGLTDRLGDDALHGAAVVIHAAFVKYDQTGASALNLAGSRQLRAECRAADVRHTIFLSSMSAHRGAVSQYGRDKYALQQEFDGPRELVVRPGLVLGKGGLFQGLYRFVARGQVVPLVGGGRQLIQTVHVNDLADAIDAAVRLKCSGTLTVAEPLPIAFRQLLSETARLLKVRPVFVPVPYGAVEVAIRLARMLRIRLPVSQDNLLGLKGLATADVTADLQRLGVDVRDYRASLESIIRAAPDGEKGT